uniref:Uncharacterized protein n=1 Tax=Ciona savignyi TaxID=51511 RepID=H2Z757_CIOSA
MSDTPNPEEIVKISRLRPAEDDAQDAVPKKVFKGDSGSDEDDIVALDSGDEADFDLTEDDDLDGKEETYDENTHSSIDLDEAAQASLAFIEDCQSDIDKLNQKANDEILRVEQKYNKLRQPVYTRRSNYINRVPHFWATVFARHSQLKRVLNKEDLRCLNHLTNLQIFDFEDSRSGYQIIFHFSQNPWFSNATITKEYHLPWHDSPSCDCTAIEWKPGMNLTSKSSSIFSWFCSQEDSSTDDIAEIIKEELWPNPLQSYLVKDNIEESGSDESDLDSNDEEPVYITDDPAEYISSGDDDYTSP